MTGRLRRRAAIFGCHFQHRAIGKLTGHQPIQFLPGRLAIGNLGWTLGSSPFDFQLFDQRVAATGVEIDPDSIAIAKPG